MNSLFIPFGQSNQFSRLILDYLDGSGTLSGFYPHPPVTASYRDMIAEKNYDNSLRPVLADTLLQQYTDAGINLEKHPAVSRNISDLLLPNTFTITTGHQLCLFTGPLFFIHKIFTTIKWCEELRLAYPGYSFVPVFWMASEDHDFAEVNHFYVNGRKITWDTDSHEQPVGRLPLTGFETVSSALADMAENEFARKQVERLAGFYHSSRNLAEATRRLVHDLFADKGLVILDADSPALKRALVPAIKKDILEQSNFNALQQTNQRLRPFYKTQVNGREINFFYLHPSGRKLIKKEGERFRVDGTDLSFTAGELGHEIDQHPGKFSPNVIMRPLYQETILPNLSYVGGPGEIAYWLQLKGVFENNGISFPVLTLRNFMLLLKERHQHQLERYGLTAGDLFLEDIALERKLVELDNDGGQKLLLDDFDVYLQKLIDIASKTDNGISSELIGLKTEWKKKLQKLGSKLDRMQRAKVQDKTSRIMQIRSEYFKGDAMQERFENILSYAVNSDIRLVLESIWNNIEISPPGVKIVPVQR